MVFTSREESSEKKQYFFLWIEKCVSANRNEELLEKYLRQWEKMVPKLQNQFH